MTSTPPHSLVHGIAGWVAASLLAACSGDPDTDVSRERAERQDASPVVDGGLVRSADGDGDEARACEARFRALEAVGMPEGLEGYRAAVPHVVLEAKIAPVVYWRRPEASGDERAREISARIGRARRVEREVRKVIREHGEDKDLLRAVFLREGYLFEDRPAVARAAVKALALEDLFEEPIIYRHRGGEISEIERRGDEYAHEDGRRATLLLNDRVAADRSALAEPFHIGLREICRRSGARRAVPVGAGTGEVAVRLVFPDGYEAGAVAEVSGPGVEIACTCGHAGRLAAAREHAARFARWHSDVAAAAEKMVGERLEFDEPVDELEGEQEDGQLRIAWRKAYYTGKRRFTYRYEEYDVFDRRGNPTPPQVCIDFVFDTWERASGNWFRKRGKRRERSEGFLDFSRVDGMYKRLIPSVLEFASGEGAPIQRFDIPRGDRIPYRRRRDIPEALARHADSLREGDALIIHGLREEDMEEHYHSVLVLDVEPETGLPMVVADNSGRPRIRSLFAAMRSAPRRSVKHRLRLDFDWVSQQRIAREGSDAGRGAAPGASGER